MYWVLAVMGVASLWGALVGWAAWMIVVAVADLVCWPTSYSMSVRPSVSRADLRDQWNREEVDGLHLALDDLAHVPHEVVRG